MSDYPHLQGERSHQVGVAGEVEALAQRFYQQAKQRSDERLAHCLGLAEQGILTPQLRRVGYYWITCQYLYRRVKLADIDQRFHLLRALVNVVRQTHHLAEQLMPDDAQVLTTMERLQVQAQSSLRRAEVELNLGAKPVADVPDSGDGGASTQTQAPLSSKATKSVAAELVSNAKAKARRDQDPLSAKLDAADADVPVVPPRPKRTSRSEQIRQFIQGRREQSEQRLLQLPNDRLLQGLGLQQASEHISLETDQQALLRGLFHLEALLNGVLELQDDLMTIEIKRQLWPELEPWLALPLPDDFFGLAAQGKRYGIAAALRDNEQVESQEFAASSALAYLQLALAPDRVRGGIELRLGQRAAFLGMAVEFAVEYKLSTFWLRWIECADRTFIDFPLIASLNGSHCLCLTSPQHLEIGAVALRRELARTVIQRLKLYCIDLFDAPSERELLKISQVKQMLHSLTVSESLAEANIRAQHLFIALYELGTKWPELYDTCITVRSILQRKNLRLIWHKQQAPFWTLRLRTEPNAPVINPTMAKAEQVRALLERLQF